MVFYSGVNGGTDSYYYKITELDREIWKNEIETNIKARELRDIINKSINIGIIGLSEKYRTTRYN